MDDYLESSYGRNYTEWAPGNKSVTRNNTLSQEQKSATTIIDENEVSQGENSTVVTEKVIEKVTEPDFLWKQRLTNEQVGHDVAANNKIHGSRKGKGGSKGGGKKGGKR